MPQKIYLKKWPSYVSENVNKWGNTDYAPGNNLKNDFEHICS